ncbi:PREDICTED: RNA polymerase II elongation factor ELL2-like isoform X2 [Amphimedon queenslandica]|uniref:OCEL domain-containing protein n=1 Tax=Amphimedon queenslandica TaxID=400682 RepID=A0AAN0J6I1_AMPQE|nr:PREDICTED: RNA polymerase II elongation factor ELL2-like isoform X2 [Amphimedon queenslandica]|eukprot:XP_019852362.1 PREDICTED: RNA polymerase II elongation factor ELL2-like isoform X2 [Amphimedon queenslandica]
MQASLNLSVLDEGVEYPLTPAVSEGRCLIHVKLTESCAKAIDGLITSNKGAFFSLWFTENGGHLTMPSTSEGLHKFQFSTARLDKVETHGKLKCLHQNLVEKKQSVVSWMGLVEHKLTVKATDEVYEATKKRATELEKERQGVRAKEINIPKVSNKSKIVGSSVVSRPMKPLTGKASGTDPKHSSPSSRAPRTLRERIMYLLAIKSMKRTDILAKLKKATKRGENSLTNFESVLNEVSELHDGSVHHLKSSLYSELDVDNWPFYSEAERTLVKRKLTVIRQPSSTNNSTSVVPGYKRPHEDSSSQFVSKRSKLNQFSSTSGPAIITSSSSSAVLSTGSVTIPSEQSSFTTTSLTSKDEGSFMSGKPKVAEKFIKTSEPDKPVLETSSDVGSSAGLIVSSGVGSHSSAGGYGGSSHSDPISAAPQDPTPLFSVSGSKGSGSHKHKKKKKHKHDRKDHSSVTQDHNVHIINHQDTSSTKLDAANTFGNCSAQDFTKQFPPITDSEQRAKYKKFFNEKYEEYLYLKKTIDEAHSSVIELSNHLQSLPEMSSQAKEVKSKIKNKLLEIQQDVNYQNQKSLLLNLHYKLEHLKKMVVQYDSTYY